MILAARLEVLILDEVCLNIEYGFDTNWPAHYPNENTQGEMSSRTVNFEEVWKQDYIKQGYFVMFLTLIVTMPSFLCPSPSVQIMQRDCSIPTLMWAIPYNV